MLREIVNANLGGDEIKDSDIKVDVDNLSEEDKQRQEDVINNKIEDQDDATVDDSDVENTEDEEEEDPQGIPTNDLFGDVEIKEEEDDEEAKKAEELKLAEEEKAKIKEEAWKEFQEKYKPNEQKTENIKLHQQNEQLIRNLDTQQYLIREKQTDIYKGFFDRHKDILPEDSKNNLIKYQETGNEEIIVNDPVLKKLNSEMLNIAQVNSENPLIDLEKRLESAFKLAFMDDIISSRTKQIKVEQEIKSQAKDKIVESGVRTTSAPKESKYSDAQLNVADKWGIKL